MSEKRWTVRGSRTVFKDRWVHLRAEDCVTPQGVTLSPFYLLDYPEWVHVAAFDAEDRLLLVRQYRHAAGAMSLELPGGVMDPHETDPLETAARELREETGFAAETLTHVARLSPNPSSHTNGLHLVLAQNVHRVGDLSLDEGEELTVEPTPWRDALDMALAGEMINAQQVGLVVMALRRTGKI